MQADFDNEPARFRPEKMCSPLVSVIVVTIERSSHLERCLHALYQTAYSDFEVVLVDCSSRGLPNSFSSVFPKIRVVRCQEDRGLSVARNLGLQSCRGRYVAFLDDDTQVEPKWLSELVRAVESEDNVAGAQSKLMMLREPKLIDGIGDFMDRYGRCYSLGAEEPDNGQYDSIKEIFAARSAAALFRRDVLNICGLFDEQFFVNYDDVDIGWRTRVCGYKLVVAQESVVFHEGWATRGLRSPSFMLFELIKNNIVMMIKNYELRSLLEYLLPRVLMEVRIAVTGFVAREPCVLPSLRALVWVVSNLHNIWRRREQVQQLRKISDRELFDTIIDDPPDPFPLLLLPHARH